MKKYTCFELLVYNIKGTFSLSEFTFILLLLSKYKYDSLRVG